PPWKPPARMPPPRPPRANASSGVRVTSNMAAAAEAMRIRRNIAFSFFDRGKPRTPANRTEPRVYPKLRTRELRALDLDQIQLTFIHVNNCSITRSIHADAAIGVSWRDAIGTRWLRPSPLIAPDPEARDQSVRQRWRCISIAAARASASSKVKA